MSYVIIVEKLWGDKMIIFGWGKVTKKIIGSAFQHTCNYCNSTSIWHLCIMRTWITLFFIPVIPYGKRYCVTCPNCGSYMELTEEQFEKMKLNIVIAPGNTNSSDMEGSLKYHGKTETQINYLKQMEEYKNSKTS